MFKLFVVPRHSWTWVFRFSFSSFFCFFFFFFVFLLLIFRWNDKISEKCWMIATGEKLCQSSFDLVSYRYLNRQRWNFSLRWNTEEKKRFDHCHLWKIFCQTAHIGTCICVKYICNRPTLTSTIFRFLLLNRRRSDWLYISLYCQLHFIRYFVAIFISYMDSIYSVFLHVQHAYYNCTCIQRNDFPRLLDLERNSVSIRLICLLTMHCCKFESYN